MTFKELRPSLPWRADNNLSQSTIPNELRSMITAKGSLTTALTELSDGDFRVNVLDQQIKVPYWHEQRKLNRPLSRAALIRQVELKIDGESVVYARSIIPLALVLKGQSGLANLGRTPLGHLLFKDGRVRISKREFATFTLANAEISARRTPYDYQGSTILVTELFLPALSQKMA